MLPHTHKTNHRGHITPYDTSQIHRCFQQKNRFAHICIIHPIVQHVDAHTYTYTIHTSLPGVHCPQQAHALHQHTGVHQRPCIPAHPCAHMTPCCPCCPLSALSHAHGLTHSNTDRYTCFCVFQVSLLAISKLACEGEAKHIPFR